MLYGEGDIIQELIKQIRLNMNMSQIEFAERLNVSFATVNRWENGRTVPNKLAQTKIYDLCKELGKQYVAITQRGCDAVRIECEVSISYLERLFIKEIAEENREKGVSLAKDICKNYRREGVFFDEMLDEALAGGSHE